MSPRRKEKKVVRITLRSYDSINLPEMVSGLWSFFHNFGRCFTKNASLFWTRVMIRIRSVMDANGSSRNSVLNISYRVVFGSAFSRHNFRGTSSEAWVVWLVWLLTTCLFYGRRLKNTSDVRIKLGWWWCQMAVVDEPWVVVWQPLYSGTEFHVRDQGWYEKYE